MLLYTAGGSVLRNTVLVISTILLTSLILSQVNGMQAFVGPKGSSQAGPITIIGPWFGSERDAFLLVLDAFEVATGILTVYIPIRDNDLRPILDQEFATGATPADVIFISPGFIRQASRDGHIVHVNSMIDEADFLPGALDRVMVGDTIYGGAYTAAPGIKPGFWYKDSLFTARGWNKNPVDYNAFVALLAAIQAGGMTPLVTGNGVGWPLSDMAEHFIATYGGAQMHRDLTAGTMSWTDPAVRAVFADFLVPLITANYFDTPVAFDAGLADLWAERNAMYFQGSFILGFSQIQDPSDMRVMALPGGVANQGIVFFPDTFFIPAYTDVLGEAKMLFQFLAGAEGQAIQVQQGGHVATALGVPLDDHPAGWERGVAADMADKEVLSDMDDAIGGTWQPTFWAQLQLLWADPTQLDAVLATLQAAAPPPSANTPPAASFTVSPSTGDVTTTFAFDASMTSDAETTSSALEVRWDWEDDGVWDTPWSTIKAALHQYSVEGTHTIRVEVVDTGGLTDTTTIQVEVASPLPPTFGGYADSLVFSVVPQDQAIAALSAGDIDMYIFSLDSATDKVAARDDPNINVKQAFSQFRGMLVNPVAPSDGSFNPFTIREIREAFHWAYDREFIVTGIEDGFAIPMFAAHFSAEPEFIRDAAFFSGIETTYSFDPARAKAQVDAAMSLVPGASFDEASDQWLMNGLNIDVIIVQRVEDTRFEIGAYVATVVEALGFTPVLDPSTFSQALNKVYFGDAKLGAWHMYTEAWGSPEFIQFDDTTSNFFYNGDFASAIWADYTPPATLSIACQTLKDGLYATLDERRDLQRTCTTQGMQDGIRSFVTAQTNVYAYNTRLSNTAFDLSVGNLQQFAVRTTIKDGTAGGTLKIAQPVHTGSTWNAWGGFRDVYSRHQLFSITDFGTSTHPHTGITIPVRSPFTINNVGPLGTHPVPTSAMTFDVATNTFVNVAAGLTTGAYVDFNMIWGEWHHGMPISMDDMVAQIALLSRMASGDLAAQNPNNADQIYLTRWAASFKGFEILDADNIRIYFDTFNLDETLITGRIVSFPLYPWELNHIMAASVLAGATSFDDTSASALGNVPLDLAKGATLALFDPLLAADKLANTIPAYLSAWVTPAEAMARWTALNEWRNPAAGGCINGPSTWSCNYMVSNGPYILDQYFTAPEGALYTTKRTGYPIEQTAWDFLGTIPVPAQPQNLQALPGNGQVGLTWQPPTDGVFPITGYQLYRGTASGSLTFLVEVSNVLSYTDTAVTNGVTYFYQVNAVNTLGAGPRSNEASATPTDTANPTLSITSPADGSNLVSPSVTVFGTASDDIGVAKVELSMDAANWVLATGTTSWSGTVTLVEGPNTIYARATDTSGNTATASIAVTVDTVSPTISITSPADGSAFASPSVTVSGTSSDDVGVAKVELSTDAANWVLATGTTSWFFILNLMEGDHTIFARATDTFGNTATVSIAVTVDATPPTLSIVSPATGAFVATNAVEATWSAADPTSGIDHFEVSLDGGTPVNLPASATSHTFTGVADGAHTVDVLAVDLAGNTRLATVSFTVDATPPMLSVDSPASSETISSSSVEVTWTATDPTSGIDHFEVSLDGGTPVVLPATATSHTFTGLADGAHTIAVKAFDVAANSQTESVGVTVDTTLPSLSITSPVPGVIGGSSSVKVTWSAADATSGIDRYEVSLDGGTPVVLPATATSHTFTGVADGAHTITVKAFDLAGNSAAASVDITVTLPVGFPFPELIPGFGGLLSLIVVILVVAGIGLSAALLWLRRK